jgi:hypothetical protein
MLDSLPDIPAYASCLFVVHAPAVAAAAGTAGAAGTAAADGLSGSKQPQLLVGEVVVSLERLKRAQLQVREGVPSGSCAFGV